LKLAILGTRGVPPNYGGFETFAAELSTRLVQRGHEVSVYCRSAGTGGPGSQPGEEEGGLRARHSSWRGVERIVLPAIGHKYLETVSHAFLSALDALRRDFDAILVCNAANAFVIPLLRAARIPVAINVDGIERKRRKWNALGRAVYATGEAMSVSFASAVIADADVIADYYREHYAASPVMIPYGAEFPAEEDSDVLSRLGIDGENYILYVSRFEPENNPLEVIEAYEKLAVGGWQLAGEDGASSTFDTSGAGMGAARPTTRVVPRSGSPANRQPPTANIPPLVMLGKGLYASELVEQLHAHASERVLLPGALYGRDYRTLQRNALLYIQATEVGGTHPALIEAMASGGRVLAHDTPENREVGGDAVGYFSLRPEETLSGTLGEWLRNPRQREEFRQRARKRAEQRYSWETVIDAYERLFESLR
jgi:glycosyltransferase involved in cell wall biosynthesis